MVENEQAAAPEEEPKKGMPMMAVAIAVGGILGITVATYVIAPKIVGPETAAAEAAHQESDEGDHGESGGEGHGGSAEAGQAGRMLEFGNILVNPAGSQGLRFLMVSIALEVPTNQLREQLNQREPQIRDLALAVLERQTIESLMKPGARDSVRAQMVEALRPLMGGSAFSVYLPQFVIN